MTRRTSLRDDRGSALVTAMAVLAIMIMLGIPLLDLIDNTQKRTTTERVRETSYNVAESAMLAQTRSLTSSWPHVAGRALPAQCTRTTTNARCPNGNVLAQDFAGTDFDANTAYALEVRDNLGTAAAYYSRAVVNATACGGTAPCTWDSNGDGVLWIRSTSSIRGRTRSIVSQVRQQILRIPLPRTVVQAGRLNTTNNGNKVIVDGKGCQAKSKPSATCNSVQPAPVVVRCSTTTPGTSGDPCLGYRSDQVSPNLFLCSAVSPPSASCQEPAPPNVLTPSQVEQVRTFAIQAGTYRNTCPTTVAEMSGPTVFVEPAAGAPPLNCSFGANGTANSAAAPGIFVINRGTLSLGGTFNYYGVIIATNNLTPPADSGNLVTLQGNAYVQGGIFADGKGGVSVGSSGLNISFDYNGFGNLKGVSGNASLVQNSFRELPGGQ
jgi:Tfp pilus assembly protein PilX